ncbi:CRISPR-associated helicase Cas3' [Streptomyces xanthochromogenes]|uniref:CRISPR-associated helicase/endonuclease Cas3 n=1 Tax=Streptomyces xanthochromogenes TaxID=67384 RepID=A0ABQ2ZHI2_9ACTN|nr:CRISPR-associated helicase Cas3' [Streptomyces xanthochromogenes]GGY13229.1 CRISPR-associated helicase/endonuclease Cas3 [Streptomyces xanthochromogenes]
MPINSLIWGKFDDLPFPYPLACHLLDTAAMAAALWNSYLTDAQRRMVAEGFGVAVEEGGGLLAFWAGLHDVGKCGPSFQGQSSGPQPGFLSEPEFSGPQGWMYEGSVRHERVSHLVVPALLAGYGYDVACRPGRSVAHQVGQIVGGHHGVYGAMLDRVTLADPCRAEPRVGASAGWVGQRAALVELLHAVCGRPVVPARVAPVGVAVLVTGLVVLADWLASKAGWVLARLEQWRAMGDEDWVAHFERAVDAAPAAVAGAQLAAPVWRSAGSFAEAFPRITEPYALQADLGRRLPELVRGAGLLLVTAPTGDGKTEGGLFGARVLGAASGCAGLAVLLPTMATTDAMWSRVRAYVAGSTVEDTPVTLLHGLAWLNADYALDGAEAVLDDGCTSTTAGEFLRRRHVGLLSGAAVGTWDQAAMAVLPVRFNALRWLGLSGKTLIIDEAHAYDAYGHALTVRLLEWLGHLGVPVVLLSATLSGSIAQRLVHAYLAGAGHAGLPEVSCAYPGWLFADADSGQVTASPTIPTARARELQVDVHSVRHTHTTSEPGGRARHLAEQLAPLYDAAQDAGSVLVVCNTVPDAQKTYLALSRKSGSRRPQVLLLHARMPVWQREEITNTLIGMLGPTATRPKQSLIVVSTQIAEQSLDVDFDLVVSDLAPLAQLLQRAGRGHRHLLGSRGRRPAWALKPRLVVLSPTGQLPPRAWGEVYDTALLRRTHTLLTDRAGQPVSVPGDVAGMIETVYAELNHLADQTLQDDRERARREAVQCAAADTAAIPAPGSLTDLYPVTARDIEAGAVTTRLGADSERILPIYTDHANRRWLDPSCTTELPMPAHGSKRLDRNSVADLIRLTVQAPARYLPDRAVETKAPQEWSTTPVAAELRLLPHCVTSDGAVHRYDAGGHILHLDAQLGLVRTPAHR